MSGAMSRNKGARAERAVVTYLRNNGYPDARRYLAGDGRQPGDIDAIPGISIEVKDQATYKISAWVAQAVDEAGERVPMVWMHPKGVSVDDVGNWWCVLRVSDAVRLVTE
jgi:hypothetical protein